MALFKAFAAVVVFLNLLATTSAKSVHAHIVAGNSGSYTYQNWIDNVHEAKLAGLDGFIMNIAPNTYQLETQLNNVYCVAKEAGAFTIFLSFDYLGGSSPWNASSVINLLNTYSSQPAQFRYNGLPVVTTFEGTANAGDWPGIKNATGGLFFIPDYTSLGAPGAASQPAVDGLASWVAWPDGPNFMTNGSDIWYANTLGSRPYMMPVSPWFYADVNNENFLYRGDALWNDRWQQVIDLAPELVQVISWNDFGESHYVGPLPPAGANAIPGSPPETYTAHHSHIGWLTDLPYFISMYKTGQPPQKNKEHITISYKLNPSTSGSDNGTVCKATSTTATYPAAECSLDDISINVLAASPGNVTVSIGGQGTQTFAASVGMNFYLVPFNSLLGKPSVSFTRGNTIVAKVTGAAIVTASWIDWNAWVGHSAAV